MGWGSPRYSVLEGIDVGTLQARLVQMQTALMALQSGSATASVSYAQGDGSRSVTYVQADIGKLTQAIIGIQSQIDQLNGLRTNRRRPMFPMF